MYRAKNLGKNRYEIFSSNMRSQVLALLQLENDLRRAIERQEFQLVYQPIVSLDRHRLIGFEALLRWHHPERGMVSPADFIPIAEEAGLIIPIGWWVLREACHQMYLWQRQYALDPALQISVNISSRQFSLPDFIPKIRQILQDIDLAHGSLKLEITEGVIMDHAMSVADRLAQIKALGTTLGIDDFGTGYSSLNYLSSFPVDNSEDRSLLCDADGFRRRV